MLAVKAVQFRHLEPIGDLLETFRNMVNEAVRVASEQKITSRFRLIKAVYESFKRYGLRFAVDSIPHVEMTSPSNKAGIKRDEGTLRLRKSYQNPVVTQTI